MNVNGKPPSASEASLSSSIVILRPAVGACPADNNVDSMFHYTYRKTDVSRFRSARFHPSNTLQLHANVTSGVFLG